MRWKAFAIVLLTTTPALAQGLDPRLVEPALQKLQGDLMFSEARAKVLLEDNEALKKKLCDLIEENKRPDECKNLTEWPKMRERPNANKP